VRVGGSIKIPWMRWENICSPKQEGGWVSRTSNCSTERESQWSAVLAARYMIVHRPSFFEHFEAYKNLLVVEGLRAALAVSISYPSASWRFNVVGILHVLPLEYTRLLLLLCHEATLHSLCLQLNTIIFNIRQLK
jgi:hypothetical protein